MGFVFATQLKPSILSRGIRKALLLSFAILLAWAGATFDSLPLKNLPPLPIGDKTPDAAFKSKVSAQIQRLPLRFEVNAGQTDAQVKFLARGVSHGLFLTPDGATLTLTAKSEKKEKRPFLKTAFDREDDKSSAINASVRMKLIGANPNPRMMGEDALAAKSHYFIGNDPSKWQSNVANFGHVRYREVYPGIDLLFYGNDQNSLEYDFIVSPGADPKVIEVAFEGGESVALNDAGDIVIKTPAGDVIQRAPVIYQCSPHGQCRDSASLSREQENAPVASAGQMRKSSSNNHPHLVPLPEGEEAHINPSLSPTGALTERRGRGERDNHPLPRAGEGRGEGGPSSLGERKFIEGHFIKRASNRSAFALGDYDKSKPLIIDPSLSFSTYLGGSNYEKGYAIAVDSSGNVYVTGTTYSGDFPTANAYDSSYNGNYDVFVTKLNSIGTALDYSTYLGGSDVERGRGIALDSSSNIYVTGNTDSSNFPTTSGAYNRAPLSGDVFVTKFNMSDSGKVPSTAFSEFPSGRKVISPYWQADSGTYSLIAVSHTSLSGMASQIGVKVHAIQSDRSPYGTAATFTLSARTTQRVFIVPTNHSTLNPTNLPNDQFITGASSGVEGKGMVIVNPVVSDPNVCAVSIANHCGFRDITQLSYWGAVVLQNTATGFAMEFVGDLHDSIDTGAVPISAAQGGVGLN